MAINGRAGGLDSRLFVDGVLDLEQIRTRKFNQAPVGRCLVDGCDGALEIAGIERVMRVTYVETRCAMCGHFTTSPVADSARALAAAGA